LKSSVLRAVWSEDKFEEYSREGSPDRGQIEEYNIEGSQDG
jgi:hypothetical protein